MSAPADAAVVLASKSPRRAELLTRVGLDFIVRPAEIDETFAPGLSPAEAVTEISKRKAQAVCAAEPAGRIVVACDTVVAVDGRIFGKPADACEAAEMLRVLSGRTHEVYSGLTVCTSERTVSACERTAVAFRRLSEDDIAAYIGTGEPFDKAGGYGIQGMGMLLVERIDGDYYNVMGLPVCRLFLLLRSFGVNLLGSKTPL